MAASRPYRLTVKESLSGTIVGDDHVRTKLDLPPVLPPEQTRAILDRTLRQRGFGGDGDTLKRELGGVLAEVDTTTGGVKVSSLAEVDVELEAEGGNLPGCHPCAERARESIRAGLRLRLGAQMVDRQDELQREVTARLEKALPALACELERVANQVTSSALKQKAAQLGEIKEITQDEQTGRMTIVVEV